jgi:radical SAM superfamily enzyme YgiQ (UPF0313 family)
LPFASNRQEDSAMKVLFVNPRFPGSLWGFQGIAELVGVRSGQAPLGLVTVAAMTPADIEVALQDENCGPVELDTDADVVAIGCWNVQYGRARELAAEFRRRGKLVVVGGPYPTLCPERFTDGVFDVVFDGEVEVTWPQFCRDLLAGSPRPLYKQAANVDMRLSPVPRFDLLRKGDYLYYFVQTTRGCPFQCEFCDIIITDGRVPRLKSVDQVVAEIETIAALGGKYVSFSDANFIGNTKYAEQLLKALVEFGRRRGFPLHFSAEMTINVAEKPHLLELLREANFTGIFVGIESPRIDSLVETKKRQNVHKPLLESVRKIQSHNLIITAGMIVGFDHDDVQIFQEQFDFLMEAGIPFTTCGVLTAIEKTPLYARLEREGRLLPYDSALIQGHGAADLNFVPKRMAVEEVHRGYNWLIRALYKSENYGTRLTQALRQFVARPNLTRQTVRQVDWGLIPVVPRLIRYFLLTRSRARRRLFIRTLWQTMRSRPSLAKLVNALAYMIAHKHFHEYVTVTHGDPEAVGPLSPFTEARLATEWWLDAFNVEYLKTLRRELDPGAQGLIRVGRRLRRAVAVPEPFLAEAVGQCLRHYLNELGVEVVPVATAALSRLRDRVDLFVMPILGSVRKGREELHQRLQQLHERVQAELDRLPKVIHFSLDGDCRAVFEGFARVGLTFTRRIARLRQAYMSAVEAVMGPAAQRATPSGLLETS